MCMYDINITTAPVGGDSKRRYQQGKLKNQQRVLPEIRHNPTQADRQTLIAPHPVPHAMNANAFDHIFLLRRGSRRYHHLHADAPVGEAHREPMDMYPPRVTSVSWVRGRNKEDLHKESIPERRVAGITL